jgi:hypothetical protein
MLKQNCIPCAQKLGCTYSLLPPPVFLSSDQTSDFYVATRFNVRQLLSHRSRESCRREGD